MRRRLEELARALGLGGDLTFLGKRDDPENFYPALDIVTLTSLNEGTPLTLIEAMANARAVIATAVGGVVDLLGGAVAPREHDGGYIICEHGILVTLNSVEGFSRALSRLITDEALRREMGERGRRFVAQNFSKERLLADVTSLYRELIHPGAVTMSAHSPEIHVSSEHRV